MGSGGSKAHEAFTIAPAPASAAPASDTVDTDTGDEVPGGFDELLTEMQTYAKLAADGKLDPYSYDMMGVGVDQLLVHAEANPDLFAQVSDATGDVLAGLSTHDLHALASHAGFVHPQLVGLSGSGSHPLVHWLDPAYPDDVASKAAIQAKATQRYHKLAAGETINGLTLADITDSDPAPESGGWVASPAEVVELAASITEQTTALPKHGTSNVAAVADIIQAEAKLYDAHCPQLGAALGQLQAATASVITDKIQPTSALREHLVDHALVNETATTLNATQAFALARASTATSERDDLAALAATRTSQLAGLKAAVGAGFNTTDALGDHTGTDADSQVVEWVHNAAGHANLQTQVASWAGKVLGYNDNKDLGVGHKFGVVNHQKKLTTAFRGWAKQRPIGQLRSVATTLGLDSESATSASRAHLQNFIASQWDSTQNAGAITDQITSKTTTTTKTASIPAATAGKTSGGKPSKSGGKVTAKPSTTAAVKASAYTGQLLDLKAKLVAHQALASDLPTPVSAGVVAGHDWGTGTPFSKGSHTSTVHTGPDGNKWMFKPDKTAKGARARAEAVASSIYRQVGIAGSQVHVATIGGKVGCVQPLVGGADHVSSSVSSWSQTEVDSFVAMHAAAWAVGDHDAHTANVLRSPSGGVFPVDQGQAFKFYGRDKLTTDWHPSTNHGQPVYQTLYKAAAKGGLAAGVKVRAKAALPVIKAFEAIEDNDYRTMLAPVATEGVKAGVGWVPTMTKLAAKQHATTAPTPTQIVDTFLDLAVARKNNLRADFQTLFTGLQLDDADHLQWVA